MKKYYTALFILFISSINLFGQNYEVIKDTKLYQNGLKTPYENFNFLNFEKGKIVKFIRKYSGELYVVGADNIDSVFVEAVNLKLVDSNEPDTLKQYYVSSSAKNFIYTKPSVRSDYIVITSSDTMLFIKHLPELWTHVKFNEKEYYAPTNLLINKKSKKWANEEKNILKSSSNGPYNRYDNSKSTSRSTNTACSAQQCIGTTQKGNRCRNRTTNCNGRCHLH